MKVVAWVFAAVLALLGLVFITGSQGMASRLVIGVVLFAAAIALVVLAQVRARATTMTVVQKIDLPAESKLKQFTCTKCGAPLPSDALKMNDVGAVTVSCPYCKSVYQIEEAPKW